MRITFVDIPGSDAEQKVHDVVFKIQRGVVSAFEQHLRLFKI